MLPGGVCEYTIASASRDFTYQIKAGDAASAWHEVQVVAAPRFENVNVLLEFPEYLERAAETVEALTLTVPEGTGVQWELGLDRAIREAMFLRDGEEPIALQVSDDGRRVQFNAMAADSRGYRFAWVEKSHGFEFTSPRYYLQVASDQMPRVELTSPGANLIAMPGRPLELAVRARDDHAIDAAKVVYRVNRRPEESVDLGSAVQNSEGEQAVAWDYRTALPDVSVGDTVSFAVEVSDRYPAPRGPHRARSETRRITFLSKEEYLKQIGRKRDRLLSRVRTIYRQERAAHEIVRGLDTESDSFAQTCQFEAIRQEMVRNQLNEIARELQSLLDDLAANHVADAPQSDSLNQIRLALVEIAKTDIARAASLLREQSGVAGDAVASSDSQQAARAVNSAARELGSLVLLRGIDSAQEVYARESRMLAETQAALRWRTVVDEAGSGTEGLADQQQELAQWTERLIHDLQHGMRYDKRPLAVLRLIRSVKKLQSAETGVNMRKAASLIGEGQAEQVSELQAALVRTFLDAEFSVRLSGAYSTVLKTRETLARLAQSQVQLHEQCAELSDAAFTEQRVVMARQQSELRRELLRLLLPSIPAPRAGLFDAADPEAPAVEQLLGEADDAMAAAWSHLKANSRQAATLEQGKAEQALVALAQIVARWSVEMGLQAQGLGTLVAASSERMSRIEEFEAKAIGLLEKTDLAAADEQPVDGLADAQRVLAEDLGQFIQDLERQQLADSDPDLPPLLSRLRQSELALKAAAPELAKGKADDAIEQQERGADALAVAYEIVVSQNERLGMLQDLLMFQRAVGFANHYMSDIVAEQRDLLDATDSVEPDDVPQLLPVFGNLRQCMEDVAPLLDLVAGRLDVGTPLAFAKTDLEDAIESLKIGDKLDAIDAQDVAVESLGEVQGMVQAVQRQTGYVAEIVEFLHSSTSDAATMQSLQESLRAKLAVADAAAIQQLVKEQRALAGRAETYADQVVAATGMEEFVEAAKEVRDVFALMEDGESEAAVEQAELAVAVLAENVESLVAVIRTLHGLPSIEVTSQTEPELVRLIDVLVVASDHKRLLRAMNATDPPSMMSVAEQQKALAVRCQELVQSGDPHPLLSEGSLQMTEAATGLAADAADRDAIRQSQQVADEKLRHFIVDQALVLDTSMKIAPSEGDPGDSGEGSDSESALAAGFISDFVSGETPKEQRTEWNVLGDRNRAALNQNFARELPLEYRGLLKNYYERLSK